MERVEELEDGFHGEEMSNHPDIVLEEIIRENLREDKLQNLLSDMCMQKAS